MKTFGALAALLAALWLAACYPVTTTSPVGTTTGLSADPALAGLWRAQMAQSKGQTVYFHFLPMEDGSFKVVIVSGGEKLGGEWSVASVTAANVGAHHFLNAQIIFDNGKRETGPVHGTVPLLYRVESDGRVSLFLISEAAAKDAIQRGDIAGVIEPGDFGDVTLTADPRDLDTFCASSEGVAMFSEKFATLTRMNQ